MRGIGKLLVAALLVLPLVWTAGIEDAWAGSTQTGTLRGRVVDSGNSGLPGVTVTITGDNLIGQRITQTDAEGNFFAPGLPPGRYTVRTQLTGHITIETETTVGVDKITALNRITLEEGELSETVNVTAVRPVVDKTKTEGAVLVEKEFTEELPLARQYQSLISFAPGVHDEDRDGNPNMLGGTERSNIYLIDGISGRDPVTGTFGFNLNYDAIQAVDIKLTGISAEYGQTQGGLTNVVTKSGGNQFTGSIRDVISAPSYEALYDTTAKEEFKPDRNKGVFYRSPDLPTRSSEDDAKTNRFSFTFGGPIVTDNAWFYLSYDRPKRTNTFQLGNPAGGPAMDGNYGDFFDGNFSLGKVTWQVSNDHRTQYYYSDDPASTTRCYGGIFFGGPCYETYNVDLQQQGGFIWSGTWNAVWSPTVVTDLRIARFKNTFGLASLSPIPSRPGLHIPQGPGNMGTLSGNGQVAPLIDLTTGATLDANIFDETPEDRDRKQAEGSLTLFADTRGTGTHTIKIGVDFQETENPGSSVIQGDALFYSAGWVTPPPGLGGVGDPYDINNRVYYYWIDFAAPNPVGPKYEYQVLYVNDDWQLNEHWSFNLGLRFEDAVNENDEGEKLIEETGFAPRLGATFDPAGQGRDLIKATASRYISGINLTTASPFVRNAGGQSSYDVYLNNPVAPGVPNWLLLFQGRPDPDAAKFAEGLEPQSIDEFTLGYERLISPVIGVSAKGVYREWNDIITQRFTFEYPGGIPRQVFEIYNNDAAERDYTALILQIEKRLSNNWQLLANYTWSEAEGNTIGEFADDGFDTFNSFEGVPQTVKNRYGLLPWDSEHVFKVFGFYNIPLPNTRHKLSVGGAYNYESGNPFEKNTTQFVTVGPGADGIQDGKLGSTPVDPADQAASVAVFLEPQGSRRTPAIQTLDLALNYGFAFNKRVNFEAGLEAFNVTNEQKPLSVSSRWDPGASQTDTLNNYVFGHPTAFSQFQGTKEYRFNLAVTW